MHRHDLNNLFASNQNFKKMLFHFHFRVEWTLYIAWIVRRHSQDMNIFFVISWISSTKLYMICIYIEHEKINILINIIIDAETIYVCIFVCHYFCIIALSALQFISKGIYI